MRSPMSGPARLTRGASLLDCVDDSVDRLQDPPAFVLIRDHHPVLSFELQHELQRVDGVQPQARPKESEIIRDLFGGNTEAEARYDRVFDLSFQTVVIHRTFLDPAPMIQDNPPSTPMTCPVI